MGAADPQPLVGRTVVTTRAEPGRLDRMLAERGAVVVHAALIEIEPIEFGADEVDVLLGDHDPAWVVVTSRPGARAAAALVRAHPHVRMAAVGTSTAEVLVEAAGRPVDVVPTRQMAVDLLAAMPPGDGALAVVLKGDLAPPTLTDGLLAAGYRVEARTAYRTHGRAPDPDVRDVLLAADALTLASGSAARSWADAVGTATPPVVVAIGPTTEAAAADAGIVVTHVAATHDLEGLAEAVVAAFEGPP